MSLRVIASAALLLSLLSTSALAATITLLDLDDAGEGFNDTTAVVAVGGNTATTLGGQREAAFARALELWGAELVSDVEIIVGASFDELICTESSATLGAAGPTTVSFDSDFSGAPYADTVYPMALANSLAGEDLCPESNCTATHYDIVAQFNSSLDGGACLGGTTFYYGTDGSPGTGQLDFLSTALHELGHGLGFTTFIDLDDGTKFSATSGSETYYFDDHYMRWLEDHSTGTGFADMTDAERLTATTDDGDLHWTGTYAVAAASGLTYGRDPDSGHVGMYAPNPVLAGSSVTHFADTVTPDEIMEPFSTATQNLSITRALFRDTGWQLTSALPCGDVTGDGSIKATDALNVLKTAVSILEQDDLVCMSSWSCCGDVTGDAKVKATDALNILKTAVSILSEDDLDCSCGVTTTTTAACVNDDTQTGTTVCGLNGEGFYVQTCTSDAWVDSVTCTGTDVCVNDTTQTGTTVCGLNDEGFLVQTCTSGAWVDSATCTGTDVCVNDTTQTGTTACGDGFLTQTCTSGSWVDSEVCASTWTEVLSVFAASCNGCHGSSGSWTGLANLDDSDAGYSALVGVVSSACSG